MSNKLLSSVDVISNKDNVTDHILATRGDFIYRIPISILDGTNVNNIVQDPDHRFVTDDQIEFWNNQTTGTRKDILFSTGLIPACETVFVDVEVPPEFIAINVVNNAPARIRGYVNPAYAPLDLDRPINESPTGDHGLLLETVTETDWLSINLKSSVMYSIPVSNTMRFSVTNLNEVSKDITVNLTTIIL